MHPEIQSETELLSAFECFLSDAIAADQDFENFCSEFGYDTDSRKAERIISGDLYELANELREAEQV